MNQQNHFILKNHLILLEIDGGDSENILLYKIEWIQIFGDQNSGFHYTVLVLLIRSAQIQKIKKDIKLFLGYWSTYFHVFYVEKITVKIFKIIQLMDI